MDVSVIIVSYNSCARTLGCISSVFERTAGVDFEVIMVDNASADDTVAKVTAAYPLVKIIGNDVNVGFGRANNQASATALGKYLFLLNSDTVLLNNSIKILFDFYENYKPDNTVSVFEGKPLGAIAGAVLNPDMTKGWSGGNFNRLGNTLAWYWKRVIDRERKSFNVIGNIDLKAGDAVRVDYVSGADMFILARLFNDNGGFDPNFFLYYEDEELQYRLSSRGYVNMIVGGTGILHYGGGSQYTAKGKSSLDIPKIHERSMFYYWRKSHGGAYAFCAKLIYGVLVAPFLRIFYLARNCCLQADIVKNNTDLK